MSKRISNKPNPHTGARSGRTNRIARQRRFVNRERKRIKEKVDREMRERYGSKPPPVKVSVLERAKRLFRRRSG